MDWISVKDRLPQKEDTYNEREQVLVWITGFDNKEQGMVAGCPYYEIANPDYSSSFSEAVTHWMPFPKPPKEVK